MTQRRCLGLVVNPIAGMGGRVALHGTDGSSANEAADRGAPAVAPHRARRALERLRQLIPDQPVLTVAGAMGADYLDSGWDVELIPSAAAARSTAADTRAAVQTMAERGVALVLFVGGDGTARDVVETIGVSVPALGVPSGVKMHSAVFATGPERAGEIAARFLAHPDRVGLVEADVVDLGEGESPQIYGVARVPDGGSALQRAKAPSPRGDEAELAALGREIAGEMAAGRLYLLGPGSSVGHVSAALGLPADALGVDVVLDGRLIARDASEADLLALLDRYPAATLILGVVGGQGFLLGRGNQQISADVIAAVGAANIEIVAARSKVAALDPPVLRIDVGDEHGAVPITGYRKVRTGRKQSTVLRVVA